MSDVFKRTVFMDRSKGYVTFHDFAMVQTSLGTMVEPMLPFQRLNFCGPNANLDPSDAAWRVDEILDFPHGKAGSLFGGENGMLHGGVLMPRTLYLGGTQ